MVFCPHCGFENDDQNKICFYCGKPLHSTQIRTKIVEHLNHSYNSLLRHPIILAPPAILSLIPLIIGLIFYDEFLELYYTLSNTTEMPQIPSEFYILFGLIAVLLFLFEAFYTPFHQHLLLDAVTDNEVSLSKSLRYAQSRFTEFIGASLKLIGLSLLGITVPFMILFLSSFIDFNASNVTFLYLFIAIVLVVDLFLIMVLQTGYTMMVWSDTEFNNAVKLAWGFIRARFGLLIIAGLLALFSIWVFDFIPFSEYLQFILTTYFGMVEIDIYINYQAYKIQIPD
jgi:hypothetical protein